MGLWLSVVSVRDINSFCSYFGGGCLKKDVDSGRRIRIHLVFFRKGRRR